MSETASPETINRIRLCGWLHTDNKHINWMLDRGLIPKPIEGSDAEIWHFEEIRAWMETLKVSHAELEQERIRQDQIDTALYRHFDKNGVLLYVGIALSPFARTKAHKRDARWFRQVSRIEIEWFERRSDADKAETLAIRTENPLYNLAKVLGRKEKKDG